MTPTAKLRKQIVQLLVTLSELEKEGGKKKVSRDKKMEKHISTRLVKMK